MELVVTIQVKRTIPDEMYKELFPTEEAFQKDLERYRIEAAEEIRELYPAADEININSVGKFKAEG